MKHTYFFGGNQTDGSKEMKNALGGKGANLAEMANLGVPVPAGFTITTETCHEFYENDKRLSQSALDEIDIELEKLEKVMGATFGDSKNPLLLSVRSGAAVSMPGMMDTVLNLGLNDTVVAGLAIKSGNERFAWDSYRRFIQMFGDVVMNVPHHSFEKILHAIKERKNVEFDTDLSVSDLKELVQLYKVAIQEAAGKQFPDSPKEQVILAVSAVFGSWHNDRADAYRRLNDIVGLKGTAVNIQAMVFGNMGETSGTGVCFSRNPSTGENLLYGEYLMNAQGEDVVAGMRTPQPISTLKDVMPDCYEELVAIIANLEKHYKDMQDIEFTIEEGKLYMLQTRSGKRTAHAAVQIAIDMVEENLIDKDEALLRVDPASLDQLLHKQLDPVAKENNKCIAKGLPASPGAGVGKIAFCAESAVLMKKNGEKVILVRNETSPEDLIGMDAAVGILTARGGMTSHAAVVARGMGKCCISGCGDAKIDEHSKTLIIGDTTFSEGEYLSLDGGIGKVYAGKMDVVEAELDDSFKTLMSWADDARRLMVRTNADSPKDAITAIKFGAEGIGLCRTEHMFFEGDRIKAMREMILAPNLTSREQALEKILPFQQDDFEGLFTVMKGMPVTIRLLDPPLHEFLPNNKKDIALIASELNLTVKEIEDKIESLDEVNPMLGHRGCRLGVTYPEITRMQARAIFQAAKAVAAKGIDVHPEIMIPLIGNVKEFVHQKKIVVEVADEILEGTNIKYLVGTMIEVPRAALTADEVAKEAEFFSFGTNDLTQMTFGFSRDDISKFLPEYLDQGLLAKDPFEVLDQVGVGQLVETAITKGKSARPNIKLGICGEHGGEPSSVEFCHRVGLAYVSCSPYRVPIAKLAAAHAAIKEKQN